VQGRGGAAGAIFSSPSLVVVRIASSVRLGGNAAAGANCAGAVPGPVGGNSPRIRLAAEWEADVKAPSIAPVPRSRAAIKVPVGRAMNLPSRGTWRVRPDCWRGVELAVAARAEIPCWGRLWRHTGPWSCVGSVRHRGQTRRRAIAGWRMRMAAPQPPQAMTTGSTASRVSRVCRKEFVDGALLSLAPCSACA
jgi:hypothetical protein